MTSYRYALDVPAIRSATRENPWRCPWCGENKWFVSAGDADADLGRVQMYCDNYQCDSRETDILIVRGQGSDLAAGVAARRADVRALHAIDEGGREEALARYPRTLGERMDDIQERAVTMVERRQNEATYSLDVQG